VLVLTRRKGERIVIDGGIIVHVLEVQGTRVRIGIEAGKETGIVRGELLDKTETDGSIPNE
jgi:carbon storage regulator